MGRTQKLKRGISLTALPDSAVPEHVDAVGSRPLSERAMLVRFSVGRWYGTGADNELLQEIRDAKGAHGEIGSFTKRLMEKHRLAKINRVTNEARAFFKSKTLPYDDGNLRLLSVEHFFDVKKEMTKHGRHFELAVEEFLSIYAQAVQDERKRLGGLWRERDYPSPEALRGRFRFEVHFRPMEDANDLRVNLPKEELEAIRREITQNVQRSISDALHGLVKRLQAMLKEVSKRIGDERERFPTALIEELRALAGDLPGFNVTNDQALRDATLMLQQQFAVLGTGGVESMKEPEQRKQAKASFDKALKALELLNKGGKK